MSTAGLSVQVCWGKQLGNVPQLCGAWHSSAHALTRVLMWRMAYFCTCNHVFTLVPMAGCAGDTLGHCDCFCPWQHRSVELSEVVSEEKCLQQPRFWPAYLPSHSCRSDIPPTTCFTHSRERSIACSSLGSCAPLSCSLTAGIAPHHTSHMPAILQASTLLLCGCSPSSFSHALPTLIYTTLISYRLFAVRQVLCLRLPQHFDDHDLNVDAVYRIYGGRERLRSKPREGVGELDLAHPTILPDGPVALVIFAVISL